ncbi:MAG TPA: hypothetical protein VKR27_07590, partial [Acidimicrobiales bacterium]|nr:hypothetical protein [Acidimicrobiales bacterium]
RLLSLRPMTTIWSDVVARGDPILVIFLRGARRRLEGRRIPIDRNVFGELTAVANGVLERVRSMERVDYSPYVGLEEKEYLGLDRADVVSKIQANRLEGPDEETGESEPADDETVALLQAIDDAEYLPALGAGSIEGLSPDDFAAQAICFGSGNNRVGFATRSNPRKVLRRSLIPLGKSDDGDRLKRVVSPELVLESDVHAVVTAQEIAILNPTQFQYLVTDATLLADAVPSQVRVIEAAFKVRDVKIARTTTQALEARARQQPRLARRLSAFADRIEQIDLAALASGKGFRQQELKPSDFVNAAGEIECAPERLPELLDALEGRFFKDAFSTEKRRADRFRKRS